MTVMPMLQTPLFDSPSRLAYWRRVTKFDPRACWLADRHYSRRKVGSPQFMPPGQTIVLLSLDGLAVFGWWRPHPDAGLEAMNGLDGWTCTIFRNESPLLSSELILDAEQAIPELGYDVGPDGLITYVWDSKVRSINPGYCFKQAGWRRTGKSADGRKTLLQKGATPAVQDSGVSRTSPDTLVQPQIISERSGTEQNDGH